MRLIRLQTNSGNRFLENRAFGSHGKYYFPENIFLLTEVWSLDHGNEILPSFSLHFISVAWKTQREREKKQRTANRNERERTKKKKKSNERERSRGIDRRKWKRSTPSNEIEARNSSTPTIEIDANEVDRSQREVRERDRSQRSPIRPTSEAYSFHESQRSEHADRSSHPELRSGQPNTESTRANGHADVRSTSQRSRRAPIYLTPVTPSSSRRPPRQTPPTHGEKMHCSKTHLEIPIHSPHRSTHIRSY